MPTSQAAKRASVLPAAHEALPHPVSPTGFRPYNLLLEQAQGRYQREISGALERLEQATTEAGRILDVAHQVGNDARAQLQRAAWTAYTHYMTMADTVWKETVDPAAATYDARIDAAHAEFNAALSQAQQTYKELLRDAELAKGDLGHIEPAVFPAVRPVATSPRPHAPVVGGTGPVTKPL